MSLQANITLSNVTAVLRADRRAYREAYELLSYPTPGRRFIPSVKSGRWDGVYRLFRRDGTFPAGLAKRVASHLRHLGYTIAWQDNRTPPTPHPSLVGAEYLGEARTYQDAAVELGVQKVRGVFEQATGTGKTDVMVRLLDELAVPTLILVHKQDLIHQTLERLSTRLRFPRAGPTSDVEYGQIGEGVYEPSLITVAMLQTLHRRLTGAEEASYQIRRLSRHLPVLRGEDRDKATEDIVRLQAAMPRLKETALLTRESLAQFQAVFFDECHHLPAKTYNAVMRHIPNGFYRFGFSATPFKSDKGTELNLVGATGEVIHGFDVGTAVEQGVLAKAHVYMVSGFGAPPVDPSLGYQHEVVAGQVECSERNDIIVEIASTYRELGIPTIILVRMIRHGRELARRIGTRFLSGSSPGSERIRMIRRMINGDLTCLVASTIFDEGVDIPNLGCLINAGGGKAPHVVRQKVGRGLRRTQDKTDLVAYDFFDAHAKRLAAQSRSRRRTYTETPGYSFQEIEAGALREFLREQRRTSGYSN